MVSIRDPGSSPSPPVFHKVHWMILGQSPFLTLIYPSGCYKDATKRAMYAALRFLEEGQNKYVINSTVKLSSACTLWAYATSVIQKGKVTLGQSYYKEYHYTIIVNCLAFQTHIVHRLGDQD